MSCILLLNFLLELILALFRLQELLSTRQVDRQNIQNCERRITEERRQRQTLESQLNSERKQRKLVEEKAAR